MIALEFLGILVNFFEFLRIHITLPETLSARPAKVTAQESLPGAPGPS